LAVAGGIATPREFQFSGAEDDEDPMADVSVRPEGVDVERIMQQLRARIRERRPADYTESDVQQLASARLDQLLDSRGTHPKLAERFFRQPAPGPEVPTYEFENSTIFATHRGILRGLRALLRPVLKLFFNPDPISRALHLQAKTNAEFQRRLRARDEMDPLVAEVIRGLVVEVTRAGLEVQSLKLRLESLSTRLDFDERRARATDATGRPGMSHPPGPDQPATAGTQEAGGANRPEQRTGLGAPGQGGRRRRRRRRRRGSTGPAPSGWVPTPADPSGAPVSSLESAGPEEPNDDFEPGDAADDVRDSDEP
jgi:hypothetical protein